MEPRATTQQLETFQRAISLSGNKFRESSEFRHFYSKARILMGATISFIGTRGNGQRIEKVG